MSNKYLWIGWFLIWLSMPAAVQSAGAIYLSGRVTEKMTGAPVADAPVWLYDVTPPPPEDLDEPPWLRRKGSPVEPAARIRTLPNGSYILKAPSAGTYHLVIDQPGYMPVDRVVTIPTEGLGSVDFPLIQPPSVRLRLFDLAGKPVTKGKVQLWLLAAAPEAEAPAFGTWATTSPAADGMVTISSSRKLRPASSGRVAVGVRVAGVGCGRVVLPQWPQSFVSLHLERGVTISGRVLDVNGKPAREAQITVNGFDLNLGHRFLQGWTNISAGGDGKFSVENLLPGRYEISTETPNSKPRYHTITASSVQTAVTILPSDRTGPFFTFAMYSGSTESGATLVPLTRGLEAKPQGQPVTITGRIILEPGGAPFLEEPVILYATWPDNFRNRPAIPVDIAVPARNGAFVLQAPGPGQYRLGTEYTENYEGVSRIMEVPAAGLKQLELSVVVRPTLLLKLTGADAKPVTKGEFNVQLHVQGQRGENYGTSYRGDVKPEGLLHVQISLWSSFKPGEVNEIFIRLQSPVGVGQVHLNHWPTDIILLQLEPPRTLIVTVVDAGGKKMTGVEVGATQIYEQSKNLAFDYTNGASNGDGTYTLNSLFKGTYAVYAVVPGAGMRSRIVSIASDKTEVELGPADHV